MRGRVTIIAGLLLAASVTTARSESIELRTAAVSVTPQGATAAGGSTRPAISASGDLVAFDSAARNLVTPDPGGARQVYSRAIPSGGVELVSQAPGDEAGNGDSTHAAIGGGRVVFQSDASNLVAGDANGVRDVFARVGRAPVVRVSVATGGGEANGPSGDADVSADGRYVAFVSSASNLVADDTNGVPDVFVRDLRENVTRRVSQNSSGEQADLPSAAPAISPDGGFVSFASSARNLTEGGGNGVPDVYLANLATGEIERISVNDRERQQNAAVIAPFSQVSDVSRNGRYVVFDSDATNLVRGDRNRDTDVFVRDRRHGRTQRVSVDKFGFEADNDSFYPSISPSGRYVVFDSFATNLAEGDGPKEDAFVYDRRRRAPIVASVGDGGQTRGRELRRQILQRPRVTANGRIVAFTSTARNLVDGDRNDAEDVFLRVTEPAAVRIVEGPRGTVSTARPRLRLDADDPQAREFLCVLNGVRIRCDDDTRLPALGPGRHTLEIRAGGPGMLYQSRPRVLRYRIR